MTEWPAHHCPGCGAALKAFPRYPWYFCKDCVATAHDREGRRYSFGNGVKYMGFSFGYADSDVRYDCGGVLCLIRERPAYVHEARFGGVVAEPVPDLPFLRDRVIDIRSGIPPSFLEKIAAKAASPRGPLDPPG
jgi:hypothetical protein